jgi:hypothetical protein
MTDKELLQQVEQYIKPGAIVPIDMQTTQLLVNALRIRLAQPEPVSWAVQEGTNLHDVFLFKDEADEMCHLKGTHAKAVPLYTAPPKKEWVTLTDEEILEEYRQSYGDDGDLTDVYFARVIEFRLKEKNT